MEMELGDRVAGKGGELGVCRSRSWCGGPQRQVEEKKSVQDQRQWQWGQGAVCEVWSRGSRNAKSEKFAYRARVEY